MNTTSGTMGDPVTFTMTDKDLDRLAYNEYLSLSCAGATEKDTFQLMTTIDRRFMAFDDATGEILWQAIVSGPVSGSAISYAVDGRQYVAVPVGGGTASPERRALSIHTELKPPRDSLALFVFALPER